MHWGTEGTEPHEFLIQLFTAKRALFADTPLALIWQVHFNCGSMISPRRIAVSEWWIWLPLTIRVNSGNLVSRLENIMSTVFSALRLSLISRNFLLTESHTICRLRHAWPGEGWVVDIIKPSAKARILLGNGKDKRRISSVGENGVRLDKKFLFAIFLVVLKEKKSPTKKKDTRKICRYLKDI